MADVSVNGWIAEGGHTIIEGKKNNIILFDVVENCGHVGGLSDLMLPSSSSITYGSASSAMNVAVESIDPIK